MKSSAMATKPLRCDYCLRDAIVWIRWTDRVAPSLTRPFGDHVTNYVAACEAHEGCPNWAFYAAMVVKGEHHARLLRTHGMGNSIR